MSKNYNITPEYITNLKLQKLLYFVQSLSLLIYDKPAFKGNRNKRFKKY